MSPRPLAALRGDLEHMVEPQGRPTRSWLPDVAARVALVPRVRAVVQLRAAQVLAPRFTPAALLLQARALRSAGAEISPFARIGPGLCLMHSTGIVIGPDVRIGRGLRIYQNVTLGDGSTPGQPTIGDDVTISAGACVLGGVTVGDRAVIGANAVVTRDVPADHVAVGVPATSRPRRPGSDPRLDALAREAGVTPSAV
ncbi:serine O-acetyltransferase [Kineococcus sp. SYSU DK002]|uniref:serine O-acetyltransferase n=1 Tax=Kineococcus sp. SYSU DK002 TaxID=3383123 RepID=UPI003D7E6358